MALSSVSLEVGRDHTVPVAPLPGGTITVNVALGDPTVVYADNPAVSTAVNQGSIVGGTSKSFSSPVWLVASTVSSVRVDYVSSVATARTLTVPSTLTYGHSYAAGNAMSGNATQQAYNRATARLAHSLGGVELKADGSAGNYGLTATALMSDNSAPAVNPPLATIGGWVTLAQTFVPARTARPYAMSPIAIGIPRWGVNDLAAFGTANAAYLAVWKNTMRWVVSRLRAGTFRPSLDASITYTGGGWSNNVGTLLNSGTGIQLTVTNGNSLSIAIPADFEGGTVALGYIAGATIASPKNSATYTITVDGAAFGTVSTLGHTISNEVLPFVTRIPNLSAGAHTINVVCSAIVGAAFFDGWWIEGNPAPLVIIPDLLWANSYSVYNTSPYTPLDADATAVNAASRSVAAEFTDGMVITDGCENLFGKSAALFESTGLHPNERGEGLIAEQWRQLVLQSPLTPTVVSQLLTA